MTGISTWTNAFSLCHVTTVALGALWRAASISVSVGVVSFNVLVSCTRAGTPEGGGGDARQSATNCHRCRRRVSHKWKGKRPHALAGLADGGLLMDVKQKRYTLIAPRLLRSLKDRWLRESGTASGSAWPSKYIHGTIHIDWGAV